MKKALIFYGGWDGHEPEQVATHMALLLTEKGFEVTSLTYDDFKISTMALKDFHLIVPVVTMDKMDKELSEKISEAVASGRGFMGCLGGMCDAFRENVLWQFMTGGNWVSHPGGDGVKYTVEIKNSSSQLVEGIKDFQVISEHYYLHVDPAVEVLATTRFPNIHWYHSTNGLVDMPVVWTKRWGHGRVYYTALGHHADIVQLPEVTELLKRGIDWVAVGKELAIENNLSLEEFGSDLPMY
jgi:type 1 glutamine amidotransferase